MKKPTSPLSKEALLLYWSDELPPHERARVADQLKTDAVGLEDYALLTALDALGEHTAEIPVPRSFTETALQALPPAASRKGKVLRYAFYALAPAACLALAFLWWMQTTPPAPQPALAETLPEAWHFEATEERLARLEKRLQRVNRSPARGRSLAESTFALDHRSATRSLSQRLERVTHRYTNELERNL